ncbi:hypothetical protein HK099_003858 [Clydaea vesicula]|uniref:Uncharacterized protein n=1 Tax=Clydaea vesicula TaxID=447962 RepID=A0AAD5U885_9FUNG|nr:hypothetical protein HK099_003858 [Clydaea vesicula]KAJ3397648.1 hypothetical protein HDU92_005390 [Lobulomyces angularis]
MNRSYHRQNTITEEERAAEPREFFHENFLRGRADLLKLIERKLPNQAYLKMQKKLEVNKGKNFSPKTIASITPQASFNSLNFNNDVDFKEEEELSIKDLVSLNKSLEYRVNYLEDKIEEINEKLYRKLKNENYNRFGEERHNESYYARSNSENKFKNQKKIVLNEYNIDEMKEQTVERAVGEVESPAKEYQVNKTLPYYRHRDDTILTAETLTKSYKTSRFDFGGWGES